MTNFSQTREATLNQFQHLNKTIELKHFSRNGIVDSLVHLYSK